MSVEFEGHVCEIQIQLACLLGVKNDMHGVYELVRALDLEDEVEDGSCLADLASACSPAMRWVLGIFRFAVAVFTSLVGGLYILLGLLYDDKATRWVGAVRWIGLLFVLDH